MKNLLIALSVVLSVSCLAQAQTTTIETQNPSCDGVVVHSRSILFMDYEAMSKEDIQEVLSLLATSYALKPSLLSSYAFVLTFTDAAYGDTAIALNEALSRACSLLQIPGVQITEDIADAPIGRLSISN